MDGAAHGQEPHQRAVLEPGGDVVRVERGQPRGQGEVRRQVLLRLQPDQVPDHLVRRGVGALEQVLAVQQGAVEPARGEPHCAIIETVMVLVSSVGPAPSPSDGSSVIATNV